MPANIVKPLTEGFIYVGAVGGIEQVPIGLGILDDGCDLALHGEHFWPFALFEVIKGNKSLKGERLFIAVCILQEFLCGGFAERSPEGGCLSEFDCRDSC